MMLLTDKPWKIYLKEQKETCHVDLLIKNRIEPNTKMAYRTNTLDICKCKATMMAAKDPKIEFFFYSSFSNPTGTPEGANCYVFKTCSKEERTSLRNLGTTYQINKGKYIFNIFIKFDLI